MSSVNVNIPNVEDDALEVQVIGEIFYNEDAAIEAFQVVTPEDFRNHFISRIYEVALRRFNNGYSTDALSCAEDMMLPDAELKLLRQILTSCINFENYQEHIRLLKRNSLRRKLLSWTEDIGEFCINEPSVSDMQTFISEKLAEFDDTGVRRAVSMQEGLQNMIDNLDVVREYIETGIKPVDECLKISKGDYIVLGARPSVGKTAIALQIAHWMASTGHNVVFYSYETSVSKIYDRIIANQCSVNFQNIVNNKITNIERSLIKSSMAAAMRTNLKVIEASGMTVQELQASAIREKADIIFIDYLGLINPGNKDKTMTSYEAITKISKDLHTMAQKRKIAIFALSQLNRGGNETPTMVSLRDSGQIEQDADAVLLLSREKDPEDPSNENLRLLQIAKNKEGTLGQVYMYFAGDHQKMLPLEKRQI